MPAAAVIPAPIAYIKVVAVKKLVVGSKDSDGWFASRMTICPAYISRGDLKCSSLNAFGARRYYFEKIRVLKAGIMLVYCCME